MNSVNTQRDVTCYDSSNYQHSLDSCLFDANVLYQGFRKAQRDSAWKAHVQQFEVNFLSNITTIQKEFRNNTFGPHGTTTFVLNERGKTRVITGEQMMDRTAKHALCDDILLKELQKYLIHDNGASLKDKGIDFARRRIVNHLRKYYAKYKTNTGYILIIDYSKFFDNIQHKTLLDLFSKYIKDETALNYIEKVFEDSEVDVSYLTDEEIENLYNGVFSSLDYMKIPEKLKTKEKFLPKHLNIGDQVSQIAGLVYPMPIDNYVTIVEGNKFYARYMDDSYIIHPDKEYLKALKDRITQKCAEIGITVNQKKTRIEKLSSLWRFLQIQYSLTETGRIIQKINPIRITSTRRKIKKLARILPETEFKNWFISWYKSHRKYISRIQKHNILDLYNHSLEEMQCRTK